MTTLLTKDSLLSAEKWFAGAILFLCAAIFLGNKCIGAAHILAGIGFLILLVTQPGDGLLWKQVRPSSWFLLAFVIAAILSIFANREDFSAPFSYAKKLRYEVIILVFLLLPAARVNLFKSSTFRNACLLVWLLTFAITTILGLLVFFIGNPLPILEPFGHTGRASGIYGQVMTFAYSLQFTVLILTAFVVRKRLFERVSSIPWLALFPFFLLSGIGLYFAYSRGAVVSVAVSLFVFAVMQSRWVLLGVIMIGLLVGTYAYNDKWAYSDQPLYFKAEDPVRVSQWKAAGLTFLENPVFGIGYRQFELQSVQWKEKFGLPPEIQETIEGKTEVRYFRGHAHNNYLESFASIGVFGGLAFLGFCFCWLREVWRSKYASIFIPLLTAFLFSGFFENTFFDSEVTSTILLIYFLSQLALDLEEKETESTALSPPSSV